MQDSGLDVHFLGELLKWTLGTVFAGIATLAGAVFAVGRWVAIRLLSDDVGKDGEPKGILVRMHRAAIDEIHACTEAVSSLSPESLNSVAAEIHAKLDQLAAADKEHAAEIKAIKELLCRISDKSH
jgi:hypothetical protein